MQLRAGDPETIGGYPLQARLGTGGMGTVFLARTPSGRPIAIKLIHPQFLSEEEFRTRFRQEVAAARRVSGAFTAAVVDADPDGEHPWMATTYITGPTLAQRIADEGVLHGATLRTLAIGLAEALRDIHRAGVVHRDLKPSNVVLSPDGPRVIDFGISRATDHQTLTMTGRVIGTPPFMSPEQLQSPRDVGPGSDVFSVATLLVYAATGRGPFDGGSPYITAYQVVHGAPALHRVPEPLRAVLEPCLAKDPALRPTADELLRQLHDLPEDLAPPAGVGPARQLTERTEQTDLARPTPPTHPHHPAGALRNAILGAADDSASGARTDRGTEPPAGGPAVVEGTGPARSAARQEARGGLRVRRLRGRWRTVVACVVAVAALGTGIALLTAGGGDGRTADGDTRSAGPGHGAVDATRDPLPPGFRPWQQSVSGEGSTPDEMRCTGRGNAVFCGGGGVLAVRLDASDGSRVWQRNSPGPPTQGVHLVGVADGTVIGYRNGSEGQDPLHMVGLAAEDGAERWSAPLATNSAVFTGQPQHAVLLRGTVLSVAPDGTRIEARAARSGDLLHTTPFPAGSRCTPVVAGQRAYAMCAPQSEVDAVEVAHPEFRVLDLRTGRLGRPVPVAGHLLPVGAADDGSLVVLRARPVGTGFEGYTAIVRVDARTGRTSTVPVPRGSGDTPGMVGGMLYLSGDDGMVRAVDPVTGRVAWSTQTSVESAGGPVHAHGVLYLSSAGGRVVALDERSGRLLWSTNPRTASVGEAAGAPRLTVHGGALVVTAHGNLVFAFDTAEPPRAR